MMNRWFLACFAFLFAPTALAELVVTPKKSECLADVAVPGDGEIAVEVRGCTLFIFHREVEMNCCLEYTPTVVLDGSIRVTEIDSGPPCDCVCPRNLEIAIDGLESGVYTLELRAFRRRDPLEYTVTIPPCEDFWLYGPELWSSMGIEGIVFPVQATSSRPLQGFSFGTEYGLEHARMAAIHLDGTVADEAGAELLRVEIHNEGVDRGWATCEVVLDSEPPFAGQEIPAGPGQHIANLVYDILPPGASVPRSISVPFVEGLGDPPVPVSFLVGGEKLSPERQAGIIQLTWPPEFIRGDANGDTETNITDAVYLLDHLFRGGPAPPCADAADGNDDGSLDISDGVSILNYLFLGGSIPPPTPPGPPGPDPTLDSLGCERGPD